MDSSNLFIAISLASFNTKLEAGEFIKARKCVNFGEFMRVVWKGLKEKGGDSTLEETKVFPPYTLGMVTFRLFTLETP